MSTAFQLTPKSVVSKWLNFELIRDFMVTCPNEEVPIKDKGTSRVATSVSFEFADAQGQPTPLSVAESGRNFPLIQAFLHVLVTCKNEQVAQRATIAHLRTSKYFQTVLK